MQEKNSGKREIVIIGGGITGLTLLLSLNLLNIPNTKITLYEQSDTVNTTGHTLLFKAGIEAFLSLGLGKRLGKISHPIYGIKSTCLNGDIVADLKTSNQDIPPCVGVQIQDLKRMLLTAISNRLDLVQGPLEFSSATNINTIEGDLSYPDWFNNEGYLNSCPQIKYGYEFVGYRISAVSGQLLISFKNGETIDCFMLLGCDGGSSLVRNYLMNDYIKLEHTGQCVLSGIAKSNMQTFETCTSVYGQDFSIG